MDESPYLRRIILNTKNKRRSKVVNCLVILLVFSLVSKVLFFRFGIKDDYSHNIMQSASDDGYTNLLKLLLFFGKDVDERGSRNEPTPLQMAIISGHKDTAELLINRGADIYSVSRICNTTLDCAYINGHYDIAELLLKKGFDINTLKQGKGNTPLGVAIASCYEGYAKWLIDHGAKVSLLDSTDIAFTCLSCRDKNCKIKKEYIYDLIIAKGGNLGIKDENGQTALHIASGTVNSENIIDYLLSCGLNINEKDNSGKTPLHQSAWACNGEFTKKLIKHNAAINNKDNEGHAPLFYFRKRKCEDKSTENMLLAHGATE